MENLTVHLKVVGREIAGIQHLPGWHTILLKQEKTGRTFKQHVQPGEKPERGWREKVMGDSDYISVPVTDDNHLRHEFHAAVDHVSPGHAFDALFMLDFSVSSHEDVALRWADDPVRKVELEIRRVLNGVTSSADWRELYDEIKLDGAVDHFGSAVLRAQADLQPFANSYGINIDRIRMRLRLSKTDAEPDEKEAGLERSRRITRVEKEEKIDKSLAGHTVNVLEAQQTAELRTIESWGKLRANAAAHVDKALGNIADNTNSGDVLARNVQVIQSLAISGGTGATVQGPGTLDPDNKLATAVNLILSTVASLEGDRTRKAELLSASLHLVAEACKDVPPSDSSTALQTKVRQLLSEWELTPEQFATFAGLSDWRFLHETLGSSGASPSIEIQPGARQLPVISSEGGTPACSKGEEPLMDPDLRFSCLHPRLVVPLEWSRLLAYVFVASARNLVDDDVRRHSLQKEAYVRREAASPVPLARGAEIVAIPEIPGVRFVPSTVSITWRGQWHGFEFSMVADGLAAGITSSGVIRFYVGPILIAEITLSIRCEGGNLAEPSSADRRESWVESRRYGAIFVSYSHRDSELVNRLEQAYVALGMDFLRDSKMLRSGDRWNETLLRKINEADIFQLCWSTHARESRWVESEWRHALALNRPQFIRPLYWENPMPQPPAELEAIHFAYLSW